MSANLFEETRMADLDRATREYKSAKDNYERLVRLAIQEQDAAKRDELLGTIRAENDRLVRVVQTLTAAWAEYADSDIAQQKQVDLEQEVQSFRRDLETLEKKRDRVSQLQSVLTSLTTENDKTRTTYYGYIVAVLVLLVLVFVLFVYSYASSVVSAVTTVAESIPVPEVPALPALPETFPSASS